jgi:hypothetical protein
MNGAPDPFRAIIQASYSQAELAAIWQWTDAMVELEARRRKRQGLAPLAHDPSAIDDWSRRVD